MITKQEAVKLLIDRNPLVPLERIFAYADNWMNYREAVDNIEEQGAIVANPRNGSPMKNPYLDIRDKAQANMLEAKLLDTSFLWEL